MSIKIIVEPDISHFGIESRIDDGIDRAWRARANFYKLQCYDMDKLGKDWEHKWAYYNECMVTNDAISNALNECQIRGMDLVCTLNDPGQAKRVYDLGVRNVKLASGQVVTDMFEAV